ncbi:hypothetical protein AW19_4154 (plasmid) [Yersinia frederiksenii Y225]|nr:hypothetical protein AW19_4154 [Yersinia frederiksenii Y225]
MMSYMLPFLIIAVGLYVFFILFKDTPSYIIISIAAIAIVVIIVPVVIGINENNNKAFIKDNNCILQSVESGVLFNTPTYICNDGKIHTQ